MTKEFDEEQFLKVAKEIEELDRTYVEDMAEVLAKNPYYPQIWLPPDGKIRLWSVPRSTAEFLRTLVLIKKPWVVLELGTSAGYSSIWMAAAARKYGGTIFTVEVDPHKNEYSTTYFEEARLERTIQPLVGWAADILERWREPTDFAFFDADKPSYRRYIELLEPHLTPGAVVVADNAIDYADFMGDYLDYVKTNPGYRSFLLPIDHGLMISVKLH